MKSPRLRQECIEASYSSFGPPISPPQPRSCGFVSRRSGWKRSLQRRSSRGPRSARARRRTSPRHCWSVNPPDRLAQGVSALIFSSLSGGGLVLGQSSTPPDHTATCGPRCVRASRGGDGLLAEWSLTRANSASCLPARPIAFRRTLHGAAYLRKSLNADYCRGYLRPEGPKSRPP